VTQGLTAVSQNVFMIKVATTLAKWKKTFWFNHV